MVAAIGTPLYNETFAWYVRLPAEDGRLVRVSRRTLAMMPKRGPTVPLGWFGRNGPDLILWSGSSLIGQGAF
jgi:hypothetical protein